MFKSRRKAFTHLLGALALPLFVACAHSTTTEVAESELLSTPQENSNPALQDPSQTEGVVSVTPLVEEPSEEEVRVAQRKLKKSGRARKIASPFAAFSSTRKPRHLASKPAEKQTITRAGVALNRYYFVRMGDTPESLSVLFYGTAERAADLVEWNGSTGIWQAGQVLYYRSSKQPEDARLLSYYSESSTTLETLVIGPNQDLKSIARTRYGAEGTWRELANVNGLTKFEVAPGSTIRALPIKLGTTPEVPVVASLPEKVSVAPETAVAVEAPKEKRLAYSQIGSFVQHNPLLVACSLVVFLLLSVYFLMQRRRYRSRFDF
jgi:hypothetical protein